MQSTRLALVALGIVWASSVFAAEIPGLGSVVGVEDPLAIFPLSLPDRASATLEFDGREIYRSRRGARFHNYGSWDTAALALVRAGPIWLGARLGRNRLWLVQEEVHGVGDALDGGRETDHRAVAFAMRTKGWEARGLIGGSGGPEGALEVRTSFGPLERLSVRAWLWRSSLHITQRLDETRFFFPFSYRDEVGEIGATTRAWRGHRLKLNARREVIAGEKPHPEQYNLLFVSRWLGSVTLERLRAPALDLILGFDQSRVDVEMALDGTRFAELQDIGFHRFQMELGWKTTRSLRLGVGIDRWLFESTAPSYFDVWPFTAWDVFTAGRYRLESLEKTWRAAYGRVGWRPTVLRNLSFALDGRFEFWQDEGMVQWKERVPVLAPFFFSFDHYENALDLPFTHAVRLDAGLAWRMMAGWEFRLSGQSLIPFGDDDESSDEPPKEVGDPGVPDDPVAKTQTERYTRGGLRLRSSLRWAW